MIRRFRFDITTDTGAGSGTLSDTGPEAMGRIVQCRVIPVTGDTGPAIEIGMYPDLKNTGANPAAEDTGTGYIFYTSAVATASIFAPTIEIKNTNGSQDTGAAYLYCAGENLRAKVTGGDGRHIIFVYVEE